MRHQYVAGAIGFLVAYILIVAFMLLFYMGAASRPPSLIFTALIYLDAFWEINLVAVPIATVMGIPVGLLAATRR